MRSSLHPRGVCIAMFMSLHHSAGITIRSRGTWIACAGTTGREVWFVQFADFCSGSISTTPNFKLPV